MKTAVYDSQKIYPFDYAKLKKEKSELNFFEPNCPLFKEGGPLVVGDLKNPHPDESGSSFKKEQKMDSSADKSALE